MDGAAQDAHRFLEAVYHDVAVAGTFTALDALRVHFDAQERAAIHRRGQRLRSAHAAHPARHDKLSGESTSEVPARGGGESFVRPLQNALGSDVNPTASGHLAIHRQAGAVEIMERFPIGPVADQVRIGDQDARRHRMRSENTYRLARLHEQRLVILQPLEAFYYALEALPVASRLSSPAVNNQIGRPLRYVRIQIVHQHPQRGLLAPALAAQLGSPGRPDCAGANSLCFEHWDAAPASILTSS